MKLQNHPNEIIVGKTYPWSSTRGPRSQEGAKQFSGFARAKPVREPGGGSKGKRRYLTFERQAASSYR
ncbi:hypothetical protein KM043_002483 [Ampulex compressa]|nr:hypothetical protein KM043_002483 [Ampulex compressa]